MTRARWPVLRSTATIVRREFLGLLRSRKGFWIAVLTVAATSLIPLSSWPGAKDPAPAVRGRAAFESYRLAALVSLVVFVPLVSWTSLSAERKQNTLVMLLSTPLRPAGIVLGKYLSTAGFFLLLALLTFPMAAALYLLGGFKAWEFVDVLGTESGVILLLSLVGLWPRRNYWRERSQSLAARLPPSARPWQKGWRTWPVSRILSRAKEGIPDRSNPIMVAALRSGLPGFFTNWGCLSVALMSCFLVVRSEGLLAILPFLAAAVICPALACNLLISERERGTLDLLRATPLDRLAILSGKLRAVLVISPVFLIADTICATTLLFHERIGVMPAFKLLVVCSVIILDAGTAGLLGAVLSRTSQKALLLSYVISLGYLIVLPLYYFNFPIALGVSLEIAAVQFALAMGIFERTWMRDL